MKDNVKYLTQLGTNQTKYKFNKPNKNIIETFPNLNKESDYIINLIFPEFTSLCPKTGQPDFATFTVSYIPDKKCLESKSIKLYFFSYRKYGCFMETLTNKILKDFVKVCSPRWMKVCGDFRARGGLIIKVNCEFKSKIKGKK